MTNAHQHMLKLLEGISDEKEVWQKFLVARHVRDLVNSQESAESLGS